MLINLKILPLNSGDGSPTFTMTTVVNVALLSQGNGINEHVALVNFALREDRGVASNLRVKHPAGVINYNGCCRFMVTGNGSHPEHLMRSSWS